MDRTIRHLGMILAAQLLLALALFSSGPDLEPVRPDTQLLTLEEEPDRIVIEGEGKKVVLHKEGEGWKMPDYYGFPADASRVDALLSRLKGLKHGTPTATSKGALKRFKLTDETFERRIVLARGEDTLATIVLGTSPGMRRIHARTARDSVVFSVLFAAHEAPFKSEDWEDKAILEMPEGEMDAFHLPGLLLLRSAAKKAAQSPTEAGQAEAPEGAVRPSAPPRRMWRAEPLQAGETLKAGAVDKLARSVAMMRTEKVLGTEMQEVYRLNPPKLVFHLTRTGVEEKITYQLGAQEDGTFVLKVSTRPEFFRVPKYTAEQLMEVTARSQLIKTAPPVVQAAPPGVQVPPGLTAVPPGVQAVPPGLTAVPPGVMQSVPPGVQAVPADMQTAPTGMH